MFDATKVMHLIDEKSNVNLTTQLVLELQHKCCTY